MIIKKLDWDSNFFKLRVGSLQVNVKMRENDVMSFLQQQAQNFDVVYVFCPENYIIQNDNINLVDKKTVFYGEINSNKNDVINSNVSLYTETDTTNNELINLSIISAIHSRFKIDNHFTSDAYVKLYKKWIEKSIDKTMADDIICYRFKDKIIGMLTIKIDGDIGKIGLVSVDNSQQNFGIGTSMMNYLKKYLLQKNVNKIEVVTQLDNTQACAFYKKNGLRIKSMSYIYHYWTNIKKL